MDEKIEAIKSALLKGFPARKIQYQFSNELHKFRIEGEKPTHWLYISREFVEDHDKISLINMINTYRIVDIFEKNKREQKRTKEGQVFNFAIITFYFLTLFPSHKIPPHSLSPHFPYSE